MAALKIAYMGSPDFAMPALDALADAGHDIAAVYTQPPRRAGRGERVRRSSVHKRADELGLKVRTPDSLKNTDEIEYFRELDLDAAVVCAYGLILPSDMLDAPHAGCINIHASLLPRWRGAAPIQRAIMAGDRKTGISIMQVAEGLDTGPVYCAEALQIGEDETAGELHDRLAALGARMIADALPRIAAGELIASPQTEEGATYAKKIDKAESRIDWSHDAIELGRNIRGLSPFPGAWLEARGERIRVLNCEIEGEATGTPGEILDDRLLIACETGALRPLVLQRQGRRRMCLDEFLHGFPLGQGERVG